MASLSDMMLADGCVKHISYVHGETVTVTTGIDAGKTFQAVREIKPEMMLMDSLGNDGRAKRILRFTPPCVPRINKNDIIQTSDGLRWNAVTWPQDSYLTVDYEATQILPKDS